MLLERSRAFNRAGDDGVNFDATKPDGKATRGLRIPKSKLGDAARTSRPFRD